MEEVKTVSNLVKAGPGLVGMLETSSPSTLMAASYRISTTPLEYSVEGGELGEALEAGLGATLGTTEGKTLGCNEGWVEGSEDGSVDGAVVSRTSSSAPVIPSQSGKRHCFPLSELSFWRIKQQSSMSRV